MDESALQHRLEVIERQQSLIVSLIAGVCVFGGSWLLVDAVAAITVWHAVVGVITVAYSYR